MEKHIPKAYHCVDRYEPENQTIVFAETSGKAKSIAKLSDYFEDTEWCDIRAYRVPELDLEYRGHDELRWDNDADRIVLVHYGWHCDPEWYEPDDCKECSAKEICDYHKERKQEVTNCG